MTFKGHVCSPVPLPWRLRKVSTGLAARLHASDRCHFLGGAGFVKVVFACMLTTQSNGCGCPAATDGLDGSFPALDTSAAGAWTTTPRLDLGNCSRSTAARKSPPLRASRPAFGSAVAGVTAWPPWRRRGRPFCGRSRHYKIADTFGAALKPYRKSAHGASPEAPRLGEQPHIRPSIGATRNGSRTAYCGQELGWTSAPGQRPRAAA